MLTFSQFHQPKVSYAVSIVRMKSVKGRHKSARSKTKRPASENEYPVENIAPLVPWLFKPMVFSAKAMDPLIKIKVRDINLYIYTHERARERTRVLCTCIYTSIA